MRDVTINLIGIHSFNYIMHFAVPARLSRSSLEQNNFHVFVVHSPNILETIHFFKLKLEQTGKSIKLK